MWKCLLLVVAVAGIARCQDIPGADGYPVPPKPAFQVIDEARIFQLEPDRLRAIAGRLRDLRERYDFPLYVAIHDSLIGTNTAEQAQRLQDAWIGKESGLVVVIETDSGRFSVGRPLRKSETFDIGAELPVMGPADLSQVELTGVLSRAAGRVLTITDRQARAETLAVGLAEEIGAVLEARRNEPEPRNKIRTIVLGVGLLAGCGLVAMVALAFLRRSESKAARRYVFPRIAVGQRLGAPYGGGRVSSRSFRS